MFVVVGHFTKAMSYVIHSYPNNPRVEKALIAAQYAGVSITVNDKFQFGEDNHTPAFLAKNPFGKVPVLDTPSGPIFESDAILRFIAKLNPASELGGRSFYEQALVDQWIDFSSQVLLPPASIITGPIVGYMVYNADAHAKATEEVHKILRALDAYLLENTFLVGRSITAADIALVAALRALFALGWGPEARNAHPSVIRYYLTLINQKEFLAVLGKPTLAAADGKPKAGAGTTAASGDKKKDKKKEKDAAPKKEKESPKKEKESPKKEKKDDKKPTVPDAEAGEEEEEKTKPKDKKKNPLDELPPSAMDMDSIKRLFSNNAFQKAADEFFASFDDKGYCIYVGLYNYNDENKVYFMTCNLVGGFIQRLDSLRKYGFGCLSITGPDDGPYDILSVWIFRGTEVPFEMKDCPDSEYYTWTKLDPKTPAGRKRFDALWDADSIDGKTVHERRFFK